MDPKQIREECKAQETIINAIGKRVAYRIWNSQSSETKKHLIELQVQIRANNRRRMQLIDEITL